MATRAQLSQQRSRLRRDELLNAAIELFAEGGSRAITHRAVSLRAGLPSATTTYYFESIDELISEALSSHIEQWTATLEALAQVDIDVAVSLDDAAGFIGSVFAARGPEVAALELAIFLAAARQPELKDQSTRAMQAFEALAASTLTRSGIDHPTELAAAIVALIAGTAVRRTSSLYSEDAEARMLTAAIRNLVAAHALGPEGVYQKLAELRASQT